MRKTVSQSKRELEKRYLHAAISEYEYSPAPEYEKSRMSSKAAEHGTLDFDSKNAGADVEICRDGAWVKGRVWVPKEWLKQSGLRVSRKSTGK
jgi:hypothetical protein